MDIKKATEKCFLKIVKPSENLNLQEWIMLSIQIDKGVVILECMTNSLKIVSK